MLKSLRTAAVIFAGIALPAQAQDTLSITIGGALAGNDAAPEVQVDIPDYTEIEDASEFAIHDAVQLSSGILIHASTSYGFRDEQGWGNDFFIVKTVDGGERQEAYQLYGNNSFDNLFGQYDGENYNRLMPIAEYSVHFNSSSADSPSAITRAVCWDNDLEFESLTAEDIAALQADIRSGEIALQQVREGYQQPSIIDLQDGRHLVTLYEQSEYARAGRAFIITGEEAQEVEVRSLAYEEIKDMPSMITGGREVEGVGVIHSSFNYDLRQYRLTTEEGEQRMLTSMDYDARNDFVFNAYQEASRSVYNQIDPPNPQTICPEMF